MSRRWLLLGQGALLFAGLLAGIAFAQPPQFRDAGEEARYREITHRLRCVMCQNQSLADSDAMIAVDLRKQVLQMMREGRSDREIEDYLVARYGEFVLYQPRLHRSTWLLWFGPLALVLAGGLVVRAILRRQAPVPNADTVGSEEQEW